MAIRIPRHVPVALGAAIVLSGLMGLAGAVSASVSVPASVSASVSAESAMDAAILSLINADRATLGLVALRVDTRLGGLAGNRARWMAATGDMSHDSYGGAIFDAVAMVGVNAYSSAEAVGSTNATFGTAAASFLYGLWRGSQEHWNFMMSPTFNYIGVGAAQSPATGESFSSLVFAEAPDSSRPVSSMTGSGVVGTTAFWTWTGRDGQLQTHTAGLRDFDVEYRVDSGAWKTILTHTSATQLILKSRPVGHVYSVRVRDRDRRNNLSPWTTLRAVRV